MEKNIIIIAVNKNVRSSPRKLSLVCNFIKGKKPPIHAEAGKRALELALASIKSFKLKKVINI